MCAISCKTIFSNRAGVLLPTVENQSILKTVLLEKQRTNKYVQQTKLTKGSQSFALEKTPKDKRNDNLNPNTQL